MSSTIKEALDRAEEDLKVWGEWARHKHDYKMGYGNSSVSRLSKDKTKFTARKRKYSKSETWTIKYRDGVAYAAHSDVRNVSIPIQEITAPTQPKVARMMEPDSRDSLAMEIESYMSSLKTVNQFAVDLAALVYEKGKCRQDCMAELFMTRDCYYRTLNEIRAHVVSCRANKAYMQRAAIYY